MRFAGFARCLKNEHKKIPTLNSLAWVETWVNFRSGLETRMNAQYLAEEAGHSIFELNLIFHIGNNTFKPFNGVSTRGKFPEIHGRVKPFKQ